MKTVVFPHMRIEQVALRPDFTPDCERTDMKGKEKRCVWKEPISNLTLHHDLFQSFFNLFKRS